MSKTVMSVSERTKRLLSERRHRIELEAAQVICDLAGVPLTVLSLMILRDLGGSALIGFEEPI